jgi:phosphohistidine phosphatase
MKELTLIRHAKSSHDHPGMKDFLRPLNPRGRQDAPQMGLYLESNEAWLPDLVLISGARRTQLTAQAMLGAMHRPPQRLQTSDAIYEASVKTLLDVIGETDDSIHHLAVIGHNPGMENLANWLCGMRVITGFVTCAVARLELRVDSWAQLRTGCATLTKFLQPRNLWDTGKEGWD